MIRPWQLKNAALNQFRNLRTVLSGGTVTFPSNGSMTLEQDDVKLARAWIKRDPAQWSETGAVEEFQDEFRRWNGSQHAFAFMGGRVALSACIHALGLEEGDEVIIPGYTCVVVPNAFQFAGIRTVCCDIELETFGLDARCLESVITPKTGAILIHHLYGLVCRDYEELLQIAERRNIPVIEDCAQATGASFRGLRVGNRGALSIYSSEQSKVYNTIQGGVAVTNDAALAERLSEYWQSAPMPQPEFIDKLLHNVLLNYYGMKHPQRWLLRDVANIRYGKKRLISTTAEEEQGIRPKYYGARMPAPVASLGLNQLRKIDTFAIKRQNTASEWDSWCRENGLQPANVVPDSIPAFLRYPLLVDREKKTDREWARRELGVDLGVWFRTNIHPVKRTILNCPCADEAVSRCVNFPTLLS